MTEAPEPGPDFDAVLRLGAEFKKESDRGAVLVAAAMLEEALRELLLAHLVPSTSSTDLLFEGTNAPLNAFSSKIDMSFRLGLVSDRFCRDLHVVRRMRNDVAHRATGCTFEDASLRDRALALTKSYGLFERSPEWRKKVGPQSARQQFIESASWMLFFLAAEQARVPVLKARHLEFGYEMSMDEPQSSEGGA